MISSSPKDPLTLWTTAVSLSSSTSIASFSSPSSLVCFTSLAPSLPSLSSFLPLLLSLSCLFLVLSSHRGSGSSKSKHCPSLSYSLGLPKSFYPCIVLVLVLTATSTGAFPAEYRHNKGTIPKTNGMIEKPSHNASLVLQRTISISTSGLSDHSNKTSTSSTGLLKSYQNDQPQRTRNNSYQSDQPPRRTTNSTEFHSNNKKTQARVLYLRASNLQYLQVYNRKVSGTLTTRPVLGLMESHMDNDNLLIKHRYTGEFLCMNETFQLYLHGNHTDRNCHMEAGMVSESIGIFKFVFIFKHYRRNLGIDCEDTISRVKNPSMPNSPVRFYTEAITMEEAIKAEKKIAIVGLTGKGVLGRKCVSVAERERRKREKKLRQRWCWSLPRMLKSKDSYIQSCEGNRSSKCGPDSGRGGKAGDSRGKWCVCDFLREMLENPGRAKLICLQEKILLWVQHQGAEPNRDVVFSVAKKLRRHYKGIARRMRKTRCLKVIRNEKNKSRRSHQYSQEKETELNARENRCRKKTRGIKINGILKDFKSELVIDQSSTKKPRTKLSRKFSKALKQRLPRKRKRAKKRRRSRHTGPSSSHMTSPAPG